MSILLLAVIVLLVVTAVSLFTAWAAQDQVAELVKERDAARDDAANVRYANRLHAHATESWQRQARNLELSVAMLDFELLRTKDPLGKTPLALVAGDGE